MDIVEARAERDTLIVVGAGFLGSLFANEVAKRALALETHLSLVLCDDDRVEKRNLVTQLYSPDHLGRKKALALSKIIGQYPSITAYPYADRIDEPICREIIEAAKGRGAVRTTIVSAVDNVPSRLELWKASMGTETPLLSLGITPGGEGVVQWTVPDRLDTNIFTPMNVGPDRAQNMGKVEIPPCELTGFRGLGLNVAFAGMKALFISLGLDPENIMEQGLLCDPAYTTWSANPRGHTLLETRTFLEDRR